MSNTLASTQPVRSRSSGLTRELAEFVLDSELASMPGSVVDATKKVIVDTLACAVAAADTDVGRVLRDWKQSQAGSGPSTVVGDGMRIPVSAAAYVNSQLANVLDADETLHNFTHFASTIVLPALAVGEAVGASGAELIVAVATGYDVAARVAVAIPDYEVDGAGQFIRQPGSGFSWAAFGTAAAVGRLMGLSTDQLQHAFGLAFVTTPTHGCLAAYVNTMGKSSSPWHKYAMYGAIAEAGTNAAELASRGFLADSTVLDVGSEFWRSFGASGFDWDVMQADIADRWYIAETSLKPYPFCRYGNAPLDLFQEILQRGDVAVADIDTVTVTVVPFEPIRTIVETRYPATALDVMASLPYGLSMIAADVPAGPRWWDVENLRDPAIAAFQERVHVEVETDWHDLLVDQVSSVGRFRRLPVRVTVEAAGQESTAYAEYAKGDPEPNYAFGWSELLGKVRTFVDGILPPGTAEEIVERGRRLDDDGDGARSLMRLAGRPDSQ